MDYKKLKTEAACFKALGLKSDTLPGVSKVMKELRDAVIFHYKRMVITKAINGEWKPKWNDLSQPKWQILFWIDADDERPGGFGFSFAYYDARGTGTCAGSRLVFETKAKAEHALKYFPEIFKGDILLIE